MHVLHTINGLSADHGGPSRSVPALAEALKSLGVECSVVTAAQRPHVAVRHERPDLVHDHGIWLPCNRAMARETAALGVPRVVSPRGTMEPRALRHRRWKKRLAWRLYQRRDLDAAAALHVTSEAEGENVRRLGIRRPLALVPNGVEVPGIEAPSPLPPRLEQAEKRALFLSRLHPIKGLPLLMEAWSRVRPVGWELVVAGPDEGGHRAEVEALSVQAGISGAVRFLGPVGEEAKGALYRSADLFVLPTLSESFGLVVAEALAAGVPVITTKGAPWAALVTHRCGWWVDVDGKALAAALREATALTDEARAAMGQRGRRLVETTCSWARVAQQMQAVYAWIVDEARRPSYVYLD